MSIFIDKTQSHLISSLNYAQYYQANPDGVRVDSVHWFERVWRFLGSLFGLCYSTAQKCHLVCLQTFQKMAHLSSAAKWDPYYKPKCANDSKLKDLWIAYQVLRLPSQKAQVAEQVGWIDFLTWINAYKAESLLAVFEEASLSIETPPKVEPMGPNALGGRDILQRQNLGLTLTQLPYIERFLAGDRFRSAVGSRVKYMTLDMEGQDFSWPCSRLDNVGACYRLCFDNMASLTVDADQITPENIHSLVSVLSTSSIKNLSFISTNKHPRALPLELAHTICKLSALERLNLGHFVWPLRTQKLPAICTTSYNRTRLCHGDKPPAFPLTVSKLKAIQSLCPSVELKDGLTSSYFIPEGILRRVSGYFHRHFESHPASEHLTSLENAHAGHLFELVHASLKGGTDPFQHPMEELITVAITYEMPFALHALQRAYPGFCHVQPEKLLKMELAPPQDPLPDIVIQTSQEKVEVDLYQLAQKAPTRCWALQQYPRHVDIVPETDQQIQVQDIVTYFKGKSFSLTAQNLSSFWAIAISFQDAALFSQIERWLTENKRQLNSYATRLEEWEALAISCHEDSPQLLSLLNSPLLSHV